MLMNIKLILREKKHEKNNTTNINIVDHNAVICDMYNTICSDYR